VITPDDKDWTWVLTTACPECGFDANSCAPTSVASLARDNAAAWQELVRRGRIRAGRPNVSTWSSLEYACHVRDVFRRYDQRVELMQREHDPLFPNWDQDASAVDDRYDEQDPERVAAELTDAADVLAQRLDAMQPDEWERRGRRDDGASFTIDSIVRYMIHDPVHHLWDVNSWDD